MKNKNNFNRIQRFSIRKYSFGAASVAIASYLLFMGNGAVFANEAGVSEAVNKNEVVVQPKEELNKLEKANNKNTAVPHVENTDLKEELDKTALIQYIAEIELKISSGAYNNKTEESLSELQRVVDSAKSTVVNATSEKELTAAYNKLVMTVNSKLRNKPVEKKDIPTVDTTNGKETVGKKAENTEKKSDSNSIENTGSNDLRNGKALDVDNAFRTEAVTNKKPVGNIPFSNAAAKDIYVYKGEETNIELSVTDDSGKTPRRFHRLTHDRNKSWYYTYIREQY